MEISATNYEVTYMLVNTNLSPPQCTEENIGEVVSGVNANQPPA